MTHPWLDQTWVSCPACGGVTCEHCVVHGPWGRVPEELEVLVALRAGERARTPGEVVAAWLVSDGGAAELEHALRNAKRVGRG